MATITRTRRRDKATTYHVKYRVRELGGREVTEMVGSVPEDGSQRQHDRMRNKADSLFHQRHIEMDNGIWVHPRQAKPEPSLTLKQLVEKFLAGYESRSGNNDYYEQRSKIWLRHLGEKKIVHRITVADIDRFRKVRSRNKKVGPYGRISHRIDAG